MLLAFTGAADLASAVRAQEPPPTPAAPAAGPDAAAGMAKLRASAEAGDAEAQVALGMAYRTGGGAPKDAKQARAWIEKAAAQKHPAALRMLGDMNAKGEGGRKDTKKALENWRAAEQAGDPLAPILVADALFGEISGGKAPGSGKFKIPAGTPASSMDDIAAWYKEAETRDPRPDVRQRAATAQQVLAQMKVGLKQAGHPE